MHEAHSSSLLQESSPKPSVAGSARARAYFPHLSTRVVPIPRATPRRNTFAPPGAMCGSPQAKKFLVLSMSSSNSEEDGDVHVHKSRPARVKVSWQSDHIYSTMQHHRSPRAHHDGSVESWVGTNMWVGTHMRGMCMHTAPGTRAGCLASHRGMHTPSRTLLDLGWTHHRRSLGL